MSSPAPTADVWYSLFTTYTISAVVITSVVFAIFIYVLVKYRDRPGQPDPEDAPESPIMPSRGKPTAGIVLTVILGVLFLGLTTSTFQALEFMEEVPEGSDHLEVQVVGFQWGWRFIYPNGKVLTNELRVPVDTVVVLKITSQDVFHTFAIPSFKVKRDAIPGRVNTLWFEAKSAGEYRIQCYELCGTGHAEMIATLVAMEPDQFNMWYEGGG